MKEGFMNKPSYIGAPAVFLLELCCQQINDAFGDYGCYLVGSALERQNWRDVDVRFIMDDDEFRKLFPDTYTDSVLWEFNPRWTIINAGIAEWIKGRTGLPIDFQIQPQTWANERHDKQRSALGIRHNAKLLGATLLTGRSQ
jgi:hypothetical protein